MEDFLREMDPAHRAFLAIFIAIALKAILYARWERFKAGQAKKPVQMRLRNGVYREWGIVQRIERMGHIALYVGGAWMLFWVALGAYLLATSQNLRDLF